MFLTRGVVINIVGVNTECNKHPLGSECVRNVKFNGMHSRQTHYRKFHKVVIVV